jgi:hypothetical protein
MTLPSETRSTRTVGSVIATKAPSDDRVTDPSSQRHSGYVVPTK